MSLTHNGKIMQSRSLRETVERAIAAAIISGKMEPGEVFSVPTLAAGFEVSATPVREAMLSLEKRGFVEAIRNKGFRVSPVDREKLRQVVAVRQLLEPEAMAQLAPHYDPKVSIEARKIANRIVDGAASENLIAYLNADHEFHTLLLAQLGNPLLVETVSDLRERTRLVGLRTLLGTEELSISAHEHHRILDLLELNDADGVRALLRTHLGHVLGWWSGEHEAAEPGLVDDVPSL